MKHTTLNTKLLVLTFTLFVGSIQAKQSVLNIYNWSDYIAEDTIEKFEKETGIKVVYDVFDSNEMLEAKLLAGSTGYDIVVPTATFMARQIQAGVFQKLDKTKLPNYKHLDPTIMQTVAQYDAGNQYGVVYFWGTTGIGYNQNMIEKRLGESAPINSWDLVFKKENAAKLADCGISMLDAPTEIMSSAMNYLGLDPRSTKAEDFAQAAKLLAEIRPYVRYFHSSQYINDLANGDLCLTVGWSGDIFQARARADEANNGVVINYTIPQEGALSWFDMLTIPADAKNSDSAHAFINFLMKPEITAENTNFVWYSSANVPALEFVDKEIADDPSIFPPQEIKDKLWAVPVYDARTDRNINRVWTNLKTGQ